MNYSIHTGDCLEVMRTMRDGSVDLVLTDPPYGMNYQSNMGKDGPRFSRIANDERPFIWWLWDAARVLKDGGALLCFCRWDSAETFRTAIELAGLRVVSQLIWDRGTHGMGDLKGCPAPRHDTVWFATKGRFEFTGKRPASVLQYMRVSASELVHPNEKPVELMCDLARHYTPPGGLILDPFTGSGATGAAAMMEGFDFIGIELDPSHADTARCRIEHARLEGGLFTLVHEPEDAK